MLHNYNSSPEDTMKHKAFYGCPLIFECFSYLFFFCVVPSRHTHMHTKTHIAIVILKSIIMEEIRWDETC